MSERGSLVEIIGAIISEFSSIASNQIFEISTRRIIQYTHVENSRTET